MIDAAMTVTLVLQMAPHQTGGAYHEFCGLAFVALFVVHHGINAGWLRRTRHREGVRSWLAIALDLGLAVCVVGLAVSGALMSRHALPALSRPDLAHISRPLHAFCGYACLLACAVHVGMHAHVLRGYARRAVGGGVRPDVPAAGRTMPRALVIVLVAACVALGAYAFVRLDVATKLTGGLSFPDGSTPLLPLVALHLALAAPFVLIGAVVGRATAAGSRTERDE